MAIPNRLVQPAVEECEGGQGEEETDFEEPYVEPEIVEQSALKHFNAVLQEAQRLAAAAEREKPWKHPKWYQGNSKRTQKRHKKYQEDLAKQGYFSVFKFLALVKERAQKKALKQGQASESEESAPEELGTEISIVRSKHVGQVHRKEVLIYKY